MGLVLASGEHGNEFLGSIKGKEFHDQMSNSPFHKKNSLPWS
jgi:hypothetical protein